ncbi:MAG: transposase [Promethearchaeia archaeon]
MPVKKFAENFKEDFGRPTKELTTCIGVILLQQMFDLTDKQTQKRLAFDQQWHYALNIPEQSDDMRYMSLKTIWSMRNKMVQDNLNKDIFEAINDRLADVFDVDTSKQRIDSTHIQSNMRRLGRIGLIGRTIEKFIRNLKRQYRDSYAILDEDLIEKYFSDNSESAKIFSRVDPSESSKTLKEVCEDLLYLLERFKNDSDIERMNSYKLMERVLDEQCNLLEEEGDKEVEVKPPKEIPSDSVQNPSDPESGYDGYKGPGYQIQIMECYSYPERTEPIDRDERGEGKNSTESSEEDDLNLITYAEVEPANEDDSDALDPAIDSTEEQDMKPGEALGDTKYGSDENVENAKKKDVEVISPVKGRDKSKDKEELAESDFNEENELENCSEGSEPVEQKSNDGRHTAKMDKNECEDCENKESCPVQEGEKFNYFRYTDKELRISRRRLFEETEEFKEKYRFRAGIEATMSELDRLTGVKNLRVRGLNNVMFVAIMKIIGINIFRAARIMKNR